MQLTMLQINVPCNVRVFKKVCTCDVPSGEYLRQHPIVKGQNRYSARFGMTARGLCYGRRLYYGGQGLPLTEPTRLLLPDASIAGLT